MALFSQGQCPTSICIDQHKHGGPWDNLPVLQWYTQTNQMDQFLLLILIILLLQSFGEKAWMIYGTYYKTRAAGRWWMYNILFHKYSEFFVCFPVLHNYITVTCGTSTTVLWANTGREACTSRQFFTGLALITVFTLLRCYTAMPEPSAPLGC